MQDGLMGFLGIGITINRRLLLCWSRELELDRGMISVKERQAPHFGNTAISNPSIC